MAKSHLLMLGLMVTGGSLFAACSSDGIKIGVGGGDAGASDAGSANDAGHPNVGEAGASGEGGASGEAGEAGAPVTTPSGPLNPQAVIVPGTAPAKLAHLLVIGTDYVKSESASVAVVGGAVTKGETYNDGDVIAVSSAGVGFYSSARTTSCT